MNKQRGSIELIALGIVVIAFIAVGYGALGIYTHAIKRAENAETRAATSERQASDQRAENARLKGVQDATEGIRKERAGYNVRQSDVERMVTNAIQKKYGSSPEAGKWASTSVPSDVIAIVRNSDGSAGSDEKLQGKITPAGNNPNPSTGVARPNDQRGVTGPNPLISKPIAQLQQGQGGPAKVASPPAR